MASGVVVQGARYPAGRVLRLAHSPGRPATASAATRRSGPRCGRASWTATGPMARGGSGATSWRKGSPATAGFACPATPTAPAARRRRTLEIAPNVLDRRFDAAAPNGNWVADCTYIWTAERRLYVAAVLDRLAPGCRLVDECCQDGAARHRRAHHGDLAARAAKGAAASFRPGEPIHEGGVPAAAGRGRRSRAA